MAVTETEGIVAGAGVGATLPFFLRRYADKVSPPPAAASPLDWFSDFARPSVGIPILGGIALATASLMGAKGKGPLRNHPSASKSMAAMAGAMGGGGFYSWVFGPYEVAVATGALAIGARAPTARGVALVAPARAGARVMGTVAEQRLGPEVAPFPRRYPTPTIAGYVDAVGGF